MSFVWINCENILRSLLRQNWSVLKAQSRLTVERRSLADQTSFQFLLENGNTLCLLISYFVFFAVAFLTKSLSKFLTSRFMKDSVDQSLQQVIRKNVYRKALPCKIIILYIAMWKNLEVFYVLIKVKLCMPDIVALGLVLTRYFLFFCPLHPLRVKYYVLSTNNWR